MKKHTLLIITALLPLTLALAAVFSLCVSTSAQTPPPPAPPSGDFTRPPLSSLSIFNAEKNAWPVMYQSRNNSENAALKMSYEDWRASLAPFLAIRGKLLDEEMPGRERVRQYFEKFKREFPDKLVLLDYNGWAINPNAPREIMQAFSAGHWLYFVGSKSASDIPAQSTDTEILVDDISRFRIHLRGGEWYDDIVIHRLNADGSADWEHSEQVKLVSINAQKSSITVARGKYHTTPLAFQAGKTMLRAHMAVYPAAGTRQPLRWYYNFSDQCPRDKNGKQCNEVLANQLADYFEPGAPLAFCDGVQFDVSFSLITQDDTHAIAPRRVDVNADNIPDHGWIDGVNTFARGSNRFYEILRTRLGPGRIITGDGVRAGNQRSFDIANGMESEGFQGLRLTNFWYSNVMNLNRVWLRFSAAPAFTYLNQRYTVENNNMAIDRIGMAAAQMLGIPITFESAALPKGLPNKQAGFTIPVWDEMVNGTEGKPGWLGAPLGAPVNLARDTPDALHATGKNITTGFLKRCLPPPENWTTINADANAFVSSEYKNENLCYQERMPVTNHEKTYFRFDTSSLKGQNNIEKITLRLNLVLVPDGTRTHTLKFHQVPDSSWDEEKISFNNAPPRSARPFASVPVNHTLENTWLEIDVTDIMRAPGKHTIYVTHDEIVRYAFASRFNEDEALRPNLRVFYRNNATPKTDAPARLENNKLRTPTALLSADNGWLKVEKPETPSNALPGHLRFYIRDIPVDGPNLTVFATIKSDRMPQYPGNIGRLVHARLIEANGDAMERTFTYSHPEELENIFYFENIKSREVTLEFRVEGTENFYIKNLTAHSFPDLMCREFENGLVLLNPDRTTPRAFNLEALFPGKTFHKIKGTQDPAVNDGTKVKTVTLKPYDGLFLRKN